MKPIRDLKPGRHFREPLCGLTGELVRVTQSGATVRLESAAREVVIVSRGRERVFRAARSELVQWTGAVLVQPVRRPRPRRKRRKV